jgi:isoleucyl-tRNA synthetase
MKKKPLFEEIDPKRSALDREEAIRVFWEKEDIFKKSLKLRKNSPRYTFYDGPPFATGTPHYGHLVGQIMKDVIPRYWTMRGRYVERRWGWDCHGLPIENIVEKELGSKSKKDIETLGIKTFNDRCRANVLGYTEEWKKVVRMLGRWADMDDAYRTMDVEYMESVWWVFGELWKQGLIYEGYRSMHVCPRCETTLSQSEVSDGYMDVKDLSVVAKFEVIHDEKNSKFEASDSKTYFLAWTTTPWTLLGNCALAVNENEEYAIFESSEDVEKFQLKKGERVILLNDWEKVLMKTFNHTTGMRRDNGDIVFDGITYKFIKKIQGKDLVGLSYTPIFPYAKEDKTLKNKENGWKVYAGDFVNTEEGTGIVHIAPAFGEDDMNLGKKHHLPFVQHIGTDGRVKDGFGAFFDLDVKPRAKDKPQEVREIDITILKALKENNSYFSHKKYEHSYPHCWRCDTALLNYATSSWFVSIENLKQKALEYAKDVHWTPEHIKKGRFGNWLEGARDWSISRQRFWASVIPVWKCSTCDHVKVISDVMEISKELGGVNRLYLVRHGEAKSNAESFIDSQGSPENTLTKLGREQVQELAKELQSKNIDIIITSPLVRTRQTADIVAQALGVEIVEDDRIREVGVGEFGGKSVEEFLEKFGEVTSRKENNYGVETYQAILDRCEEFIKEVNEKYQGKTIAVVGHRDTVLAIEALCKKKKYASEAELWHPENAEVRSVFSKKVDLHRPYIDEVKWPCKCGGEMKRIPDVLDTWFDSGSMPYAQKHYPFEHKTRFGEVYPADFIAEGVDQTRAWFYYLHMLGTAIQKERAFSNVIVNGIVLAEDGKKMSKKLKNYPDPKFMMEKYGADVLRVYLMGSPVVMAENLNFSEKELSELSRGLFRMLRNTYSFFVMYANVDNFQPSTSERQTPNAKRSDTLSFYTSYATLNVLDRWILSELQLLIKEVNDAMESYELARAVRHFTPFMDDLSNWYIRRSRKRFWKSENDGDKNQAYETLHFVLVEFSKLFAPFAPFISEEMYRNLSGTRHQVPGSSEYDSVHLAKYPQVDEGLIDEKLIEEMKITREIISEGLQLRADKGVRVRQPLKSLHITGYTVQKEMMDIIKEELNVQELLFEEGEKNVELDVRITPELKREGQAREIIRTVQSMRKKAGYNVDDRITLWYDGMEEVFKDFGMNLIAKEVLAQEVLSHRPEHADKEEELVSDGEKIKLFIRKA